jgi:hypothetical protein
VRGFAFPRQLPVRDHDHAALGCHLKNCSPVAWPDRILNLQKPQAIGRTIRAGVCDVLAAESQQC